MDSLSHINYVSYLKYMKPPGAEFFCSLGSGEKKYSNYKVLS